MLPPFISDSKDKHPTFIFSVIRSRMLPPFISDAIDKHSTFIFSVIQSRMLLPFISDTKDKHQTFIISVIRSRMLPPFISDAKDKHPTFIFNVIRSRMLLPFISDAKDKRPKFIFLLHVDKFKDCFIITLLSWQFQFSATAEHDNKIEAVWNFQCQKRKLYKLLFPVGNSSQKESWNMFLLAGYL